MPPVPAPAYHPSQFQRYKTKNLHYEGMSKNFLLSLLFCILNAAVERRFFSFLQIDQNKRRHLT